MEPYYGRRGKESSWGINRATQTQFLMLAMVATMVCVLLWEASPFYGAGLGRALVLKSGVRREFELPSTVGEARPFLKSPAPSEGVVPGLDAAEVEGEEAVDTILPEPEVEGEEAVDTTVPEPAVEEKERAPTQEDDAAMVQRASNETLAEMEEAVLAEGEISLVDEAPVPSPEDLILDAVLDSRPMAKPLEEAQEPSPARARKPKSKRRNSSAKCDYYSGKWILDTTRPIYSGVECKLWLSTSYSCRIHNHPDSLLDRYRWQPNGCDLPQFNETAALESLRNKVIGFVGDSLGRQQWQSLLCMLTRGKNETEVTDVGSSFGFYRPPGERPTGQAHRFEATNTTIVYKWSVTLARIQPLNASDPLTINALHLDRPEQFIEDYFHDLDVLVLNTGHHWNGGKMRNNRYHFHVNGKPVKNTRDFSKVYLAYNQTVHSVVRWVDRALKGTDKIAYYRTLSPRHFRNGDWNTGGTCDNIRFQDGLQVQEGERTDPKAESAVMGTRVKLLNITALSFERGEAHVSKYGDGVGGQDCLHWCLPGIPDTWNEILLAELATKLKRRAVAH